MRRLGFGERCGRRALARVSPPSRRRPRAKSCEGVRPPPGGLAAVAPGWGGVRPSRGGVGVQLACPAAGNRRPFQPKVSAGPSSRPESLARPAARNHWPVRPPGIAWPVRPPGIAWPINRQGGNERGRPLDRPGRRKHRRNGVPRSAARPGRSSGRGLSGRYSRWQCCVGATWSLSRNYCGETVGLGFELRPDVPAHFVARAASGLLQIPVVTYLPLTGCSRQNTVGLGFEPRRPYGHLLSRQAR